MSGTDGVERGIDPMEACGPVAEERQLRAARAEPGGAHADQPDRAVADPRQAWIEEAPCRLQQYLLGIGRGEERRLHPHRAEISGPEAERDDPRGAAMLAQFRRRLVAEDGERRPQQRPVATVLAQGVLVADGLHHMTDGEGRRVLPAGMAGEAGAEVAEERAQLHLRHRSQFAERAHGDGVQGALGRRADAGHRADRQRGEEGRLFAGRDGAKAVRLGRLRGDLRRRAPGGEADGDDEGEFVAHAAADVEGDQFRRAADPLHPRHIDCRLVRPGHLDERAVRHEDGAEAVGEIAIICAIDRQEDGVRAAPLRLGDRHAGADTEDARRVRGSTNDPAPALPPADDHRQPDQFRAAGDLGGGEEGIQIGVQDGARPSRVGLRCRRARRLAIDIDDLRERATEGKSKEGHRVPPRET